MQCCPPTVRRQSVAVLPPPPGVAAELPPSPAAEAAAAALPPLLPAEAAGAFLPAPAPPPALVLAPVPPPPPHGTHGLNQAAKVRDEAGGDEEDKAGEPLGEVMETAEDIEIDVPKIWDYIGELLCPPVANRTLPLGTLISTTFPSNLLTSGKAALLITKLLRQCVVVTSEEVVFQLWSSCKEQHGCLQLRPGDLKGLEFLCVATHNFLEGLTDRLRSANVTNNKIMDWIESV
ncbi:hypothetical protein EMCRGX_G016027 [Ephydatia muelleri]